MDHSEAEHRQGLLSVLNKLLESKNINDTYMDQILTTISNELRTQNSNISICILINWISATIDSWKKTQISWHEAQFVCKFIEFLSNNNNETVSELKSKNVLNDLTILLNDGFLTHTTMKITFIKMLSAIIEHKSGFDWIITSQIWKLVFNTYFSSVNMYVEREGIKFFKKLISTAKNEDYVFNDILQHVFLPIEENFKDIKTDKKLHSKILLFLKVLEIILKVDVLSENSNLKPEKISNIKNFVKTVIENSEEETILEAALVSQVLFTVLIFEDKKKLLSAEDIPAILDLFNTVIKQNQFNCLIKLAKYCQLLWCEMQTQMQCENTFGRNFILIQLLPSLLNLNLPISDTQDKLFMEKLCSQIFFHLLGKSFKSSFTSAPNDLTVKSILSVIRNLESLNLEEAVLIFHTLLLVIKSVISENGYDLETTQKIHKKLGSSEIKKKQLLSAALSGVSLLLEEFKMNKPDLEELGLFKIIHCLLKIVDLPSLVIVQTLTVVKTTISNCMLPGAIITSIQSNFKSLMPVIYKLMTVSCWEIRDSAIEVVIAIAELISSKYDTALEQLLLEKDFCSLFFTIIENDTESYVRASALRALSVMTKIEALNPFLSDCDSCLKITKLVETESEGIVRREAALLVKEIFLTLNDDHSDLINLFYNVMGGAALSDLHWEVKINSLVFWETVIQQIITQNGIKINSSSSSAFVNKEVINLSENDMKQRIEKSLKKLSKTGCLYVLLTLLTEDYDMVVIQKSAEVLSALLSYLKHDNVNEGDTSSCTTAFRKRKNSGVIECEKNKVPSLALEDNIGDLLQESISISSAKSEKIIEEIVNETDINLLKKVSFQNENIYSCHKSVILKEIEPQEFLIQMQGFDKDRFLENKQKWFTNVESDLSLTINKINIDHPASEINVMDCY